MTEFISKDELTYVLSMPKGRKVIAQILSLGGFARQPFDPSSQRMTDFNAGNLNIGLQLYADCMSADPGLTAMMLKEHHDDNNRKLANPDKRPEQPTVDSDGKPTVRTEPNAANELGLEYDRLGNRLDRVPEVSDDNSIL